MTLDKAQRLVLDQKARSRTRCEAFCIIWGSSLPRQEKVRIVNLALADREITIRRVAAKAAGRMGDASTVKILANAIHSADEDTARYALMSYSELLGRKSMPTLMHFLSSGDSRHQSNALAVLAGMEGDAATRALLATFRNHPDAEKRYLAAFSLANRGANEIIPLLLQHLKDDNCAAFALAKLGVRAGFHYIQRLLARRRLSAKQRNLLLLWLRLNLRPRKVRTDEEVLADGRAWVTAELQKEK